MPFFGVPIRNGLPIGLGSVAGFGVQQFDPSQLFEGGTVAGAWYDPSDLSTMFDTSTGTTPVAMPGQGAAVPVGRMLDKSGNGNHAIAFNNTTARPELRARVNLLTYSEDQSNGVWSSYNATQQSNVGIAPDGTNTADRIVEASGSSLQARYQTLAGGLGISYTVSAYAKADQRNVFNLSYSGVGGTNWFAATFELTGNGSVTKTGAGAAGTYTSSSITPVGNGWYFCTVTGSPGQASTHYVYGGPSDTNNPTYGNFGVLTYSGNTANGVLAWGFDVRPANIGANVPAYQRIADANTYDTSGFPLYLLFEGAVGQRGMYTPASIPFATVTSDGQARRNLLNNPTQFDVTSSWTPTSMTVLANVVAAPDGTLSAESLLETAVTTAHAIEISGGIGVSSVAYTASIYAKYNGRVFQLAANLPASNVFANFDLQNGVLGTVSGVTAAIQDAENGWYRCSITVTAAAGTRNLYPNVVPSTTSGYLASGAGDITKGVYLYGAQLELGSTATAFQNIGTDKVAVFAGVRKLSDAAAAIISEFSASAGANNGTLYFAGPAANGAADFAFASKGTTIRIPTATGLSAPLTRVISGIGDISGDLAQLRVNGAVAATETGDQGTGNFGTYPLYIGARNNASLWFNGHLHSLIIAGSAVSAGNISATEQWVAGKTGIQI